MDDAEIRRERDALQSRIDELSLAQRRLIEIEAAAAQIHDAHFAQPLPIVAGDGDQLTCAGGAVSSANAGGSLPRRSRDPAVPMATGDRQDPDDHYPLLGGDPFREPAEEHDATPPPQLGYYQENGGGGVPVMASDDDFYALEEPEGEYRLLLPDPALYDDVPASGGGEATPVTFSDSGFGGVPASAAAIAGLKKQRYDDGGPPGAAGDDMCVICMRGYKRGKRLYVMPCAYRHRFHRKCLKKWLSRSHLCPLCRHALPTEDQPAVWLLNVN